MRITVGTFNLNNLFSRFNFRFQAEAESLKPGRLEFKKVRDILASIDSRRVQYEGIAVHRKTLAERQAIADRIKRLNLDVLAVQEVEDIETLRYFVQHELDGGTMYPYMILLEGNDPRLIDLAILSKYPIGAVTTWQHAVHPDNPGERVFSRDLLQVDILNNARTEHLLTVFNNHLKSHFVPYYEDQVTGKRQANQRRKRQAEVAAAIVAAQMRARERFVVLGDFNDPPDSPHLEPLVRHPGLQLTNGLRKPTQTRPTPTTTAQLPPHTAWTHRFKPSGKPARYELLDQIWLSPSLASKQTGAFIDRRSKLGGDGSDHDPAWVELAL